MSANRSHSRLIAAAGAWRGFGTLRSPKAPVVLGGNVSWLLNHAAGEIVVLGLTEEAQLNPPARGFPSSVC